MEEYFQTRERYVKHLWFRYEGIVYRGNGVLTWNPDKGFHIIAGIKGNKVPGKKEFHSIQFNEPTRIRMEMGDGTIAITPLLRFSELGLYWSETFSINIGQLILVKNLNNPEKLSEKWGGSAIYEADARLLFPDIVRQETTVGEVGPLESYSRAGFDYDGNNGEKIWGEVKDNKYIYFSWSFPKQNWTKNQAFRFADGLRYALSALSGETVQLRYHEAERDHRIAKVFNSNEKPILFGLILRLFDQDIIDKNSTIQLAYFFAQENEQSKICKRIYHQIEAAVNQDSQQATELLLSTTLEAALRSIYHLPFAPGRSIRSDPFKLPNALKQFCSDYLTSNPNDYREWKKIIDKVSQAYSRLRHRNAHPDWLYAKSGMFSEKEMEQTVNDMILLSRFYGYMILGLAGFQNIQPVFPAPMSNWKPYMTFESKTAQ